MPRIRTFNSLAAAVFAVAVWSGPAAASFDDTPNDPVEVTRCGQVLSGPGFLAADLDCTHKAFNKRAALRIKHQGKLEMNGHRIVKGKGKQGIRCFGPCTIQNGEIVTLGKAKAAVMSKDKLTVINLFVDGTWNIGVMGRRGVEVFDSTIRNVNRFGVKSLDRDVFLKDSQITGVGLPGKDRAGVGVVAWERAVIENSVITNNYRFGVVSRHRRVILNNSTVTNNNIHDLCQQDRPCADVHARRRPDIFQSTCGTSQMAIYAILFNNFPTASWGVCSED